MPAPELKAVLKHGHNTDPKTLLIAEKLANILPRAAEQLANGGLVEWRVRLIDLGITGEQPS